MPTIPCTTDDLIVGTYYLCLNDIDLGATSGGVSITQSNTFVDVFNDQTRTLQAKFKTQEIWTITATMRNMTLDRLRVILGVKEGLNVGGDTLCFRDPGNCSFPEEFALTVIGPGPGCGCRNFHFPRVVFTPDSVEYNIQRDVPGEIQVEFTALASCPEGLIGCVTDVCDTIATDEVTTEALVCNEGAIPNYVP
jgi:hypothetical protein